MALFNFHTSYIRKFIQEKKLFLSARIFLKKRTHFTNINRRLIFFNRTVKNKEDLIAKNFNFLFLKEEYAKEKY